MKLDKPSILIVDDEKNTREGLSRALEPTYQVFLAESGSQALEILSEQNIDIFLSDLRMPGMDGLTLMRRVLAHSPQPVFILLTAYGSIEQAVKATKDGAYDFLTKPVNLKHLGHKLTQALRSRGLEAENRQLLEQLDTKFGLENIMGQSAVMQEVFDTIRQVSSSRASVLIDGESGTGKELVAHAIHQLRPRAQGPFVAVHAAALSETLLESDSSIQAKMLRVLEQRAFERVGGNESVHVDVRLITATNRDLKSMVEEGSFREDLFYRLYVVAIHMPPLRDRPGDIPLLINYFLRQFCEENNKSLDGITPDALDALTTYSWQGNVRELRNVVERMVVMSRGDRLTLREIPAAIREQANCPGRIRPGSEVTIEDAERSMIMKALKNHGGNRTRAAEQLGISRRTLHRKINEFELRGKV